jgi:hypothetical protein
MRRVLILAVALALVGSAAEPVFACALMYFSPGGCRTLSCCVPHFDTVQGTIMTSSMDRPCCFVSASAFTAPQKNASNAPFPLEDAEAPVSYYKHLPSAQPMADFAQQQGVGPPLLQSFLCTFLI